MAALTSIALVVGAAKPPEPTEKPVIPDFRGEHLEYEMKQIEFRGRVKRSINYNKLLDAVKRAVPSDGREVVDWMHDAFVAKQLAAYFAECYCDSGGYADATAGDGYIPGVSYSDVGYYSEPGYVVSRRGYALAYAFGARYTVPLYTRTFNKDHRAQFLIPRVWQIQWSGVLAKIKQYITVPFQGSLPLVNMPVRDTLLTFPVPVFQYTARPLRRVISVDVDYEKPVPIKLLFWDSNFENKYVVNVRAPESPGTYRIRVFGVPLSGYMEVYADGTDSPPTIVAVTNRVLW